MNTKPKVISTNEEARKKLKKGVDTVADLVKATLGNGGRNIIFEYVPNRHIITNDGVSIAQQVFLEDPIENIGANVIKEACEITNRKVGDGTSTATLLTQAILNKGFKELDNATIIDKINPIDIKRKLDKDIEPILEELLKRSKPIKTAKEREQVAMTSVEDEKLAKMISEILGKVGDNAHIKLEKTELDTTDYDIIEGVKYNRGWFAPFMMNNEKAECSLEDPYILLTDREINDPLDLEAFVDYASKKGKPLVVVADNFSANVLGTIATIRQKSNYQILAIETQKVEKEERLKDLAVMTDAIIVESSKDMDIKEQEPETVLGRSKVVTANKSFTHFSGGYTEKKRLKERLNEYQVGLDNAIAKNQKNMKEAIERKMSEFNSGTVIINIGGRSQQDREYKYRKIEDAVNATRHAMKAGIVRGGGIELLDIAKTLKDNYLADIITKPNEQILLNNGGQEIPDTIIDPTYVVETALKTAVSVAGTLLTTEGVIALKRDDFKEELKQALQ